MEQRKIIINREKCIGCGICAKACKHSAIEMLNGKAFVANESSCDKVGFCIPKCPVSAISFSNSNSKASEKTTNFICKSSESKTITRNSNADTKEETFIQSKLSQWPVQLKLVLPTAGYFNNCDLLISADCSAYAYGNFHSDFIKGRTTIIACPKLDGTDYTDKLYQIIKNNNIKSITVTRMEVPCCTGIANYALNALKLSKKDIPLNIVTFSTNGEILSDVSESKKPKLENLSPLNLPFELNIPV